MIAIIDYGVGNLFSLRSSLRYIGAECELMGNADKIAGADGVILPGVGAFGDAAAKLRESGLMQTVLDEAAKGKPLLGICLGMQLLFDKSEEYGEHNGLGLIPGTVKSLLPDLGDDSGLKVPHIGWNRLSVLKECPLLKHTSDGECFYYVHSFYVPAGDAAAAVSDYGAASISGVVWCGNVFGTQFHPEKSGGAGLDILRAFAEMV